MKNRSIRQLDFKSRAGSFSFGDKKKSRLPKLFLTLIIAIAVVGLVTVTISSFGDNDDSSSENAENNITTVPSQLDNNTEEENSEKNQKIIDIPLAIPKDAPSPNGINIPLNNNKSSNLAPTNLTPTRSEEDGQKQSNIQTSNNAPSDKLAKDITTGANVAQNQSTEINLEKVETYTVKKGDTLSAVFKRASLSARDLITVSKVDGAKNLTRIYPGEKLHIRKTKEGNLGFLSKRISDTETFVVNATDSGFSSEVKVNTLDFKRNRINSTIDSSLYLSAKDAGLDDNMIMQLAGIFGWDIDFALDIRKGDSFSIIYEEIYRDGEMLRNGNIIAAEFFNKGKRHVAVRYTDPKGDSDYFTPNGKRMKKAFLRAPVDFRRISSRFQKQRWHPVLGKKRPHRGVDYAAAVGTPIKASGDGKVVFRGWKGGYGRTVIIKHGSKYKTLYGHLSKYKKNVKKGSRVKQGQTIGYVGKSGLATGPHLHYEFRVNGVHRNPVTVKLPDATPINKKYRKDFEEKVAPLIAEIDTYSRTVLALREKEEETESSVE